MVSGGVVEWSGGVVDWRSGGSGVACLLTLLYVLLGHQPHAHLAVYSADMRIAAPSRLLYIIRIDLKREGREGEW